MINLICEQYAYHSTLWTIYDKNVEFCFSSTLLVFLCYLTMNYLLKKYNCSHSVAIFLKYTAITSNSSKKISVNNFIFENAKLVKKNMCKTF